MKLALLGYGQMGQMIEHVALEREHTIIAAIDAFNPLATHQEISEEIIQDADVCIDFTLPDTILSNIRKVTDLKKNLVVGTTGWYDKLDEIKTYIEQADTGLIYAPNFSLGVNLFKNMVEYAAKLMNFIDEYDIGGIEYHHKIKAESPSGTAKALADVLLKQLDRKKQVVYDSVDRKINPEELHFPSLRVGHVPGTHRVIFDSSADTITLSHEARNRRGFALGAVLAAEWIVNKKGFFSIDDFIEEMIHHTKGLI